MPFAPIEMSWFELDLVEARVLEARLERLVLLAKKEAMAIRCVDIEFRSVRGARAVALDCAFTETVGHRPEEICTAAAAVARCILRDRDPFEASQTRLDLINAELAYKAMAGSEGEDAIPAWARLVAPTDIRVTFRIHPDPAMEVFAEVAGVHPMEMSAIPPAIRRLGAPIYEVPIHIGVTSDQETLPKNQFLQQPAASQP